MSPALREAPTAAEHVRTVLATAATVEVWWLDDRGGRTGPITTPTRQLVIETGGPGPTARPLLVEVADAAPLPVRSRIRARIRLSGQGAVDDDQLVRVCPVGVELLTDGGSTTVRPGSLLDAAVDPLAHLEGVLLSHLAAAHPEVTERLTLLLSPRLLQGVVRAVPHALDRYGVVLRLEYARSHRDVRLAFATPADTVLDVRHRLGSLMTDAGSRRVRRRCAPEVTPGQTRP